MTTVRVVGRLVPTVNVIWLSGLPNATAVAGGNGPPLRVTVPTTSLTPVEAVVFGCVRVNAPVARSLLVKVSAPLIVAFPFNVTPVTLRPIELLMVRLL